MAKLEDNIKQAADSARQIYSTVEEETDSLGMKLIKSPYTSLIVGVAAGLSIAFYFFTCFNG